MDHMDLIYRKNGDVKYVIAVLGEKQVYNPMRESIKRVLHSYRNPVKNIL